MKKMSQEQVASKPFLGRRAVDEAEHLYVGIDTHKGSYHVAVWSQEREMLVDSWTQPADWRQVDRRLSTCREQVVKIVYEAGPTGFGLAESLRESCWETEVISAAHTPQLAADSSKSDSLDARHLAVYSGKGLLRPVYIPTREELADRQIVRLRYRATKGLRRAKQRIKAFLLFHGLAEPAGLRYWTLASIEGLKGLSLDERLRWGLDQLVSDLEYWQGRLREATSRLRQLRQEARYCERVALLCGVPGVGPVTAMTFVLELPSLERFGDARQLSRALGLSPQVRSSGERRRECGREKGGGKWVRAALVEAAWQWRRRDPWARMQYNRFLGNTGSSKKANVALARKLAIVLWRMATTGTPYCPGMTRIPPQILEAMKRRESRQAKGK